MIERRGKNTDGMNKKTGGGKLGTRRERRDDWDAKRPSADAQAGTAH